MSDLVEKAIVRLMKGRLEDARRSCSKVLRQDPDQPQALLLMAEISRRRGDAAGATPPEERLLRLQPGWTRAHLAAMVGALYEEFGHSVEAGERYRRALELDAGLGDARERLVRLLFRERRFEEMEAPAREGMERFPQEALYPERLATMAWFLGRREEALAGYALAMARATTDEARQVVGGSQANVLLALGRYAEGWQAFRWRQSRALMRSRGARLMEDPEKLSTLAGPAQIRILEEQGLGDEIFFLRFAVALRERGHSLSFRGEKRLMEILPPFLQGGAEPQYTIATGDLPLASGQSFAPPLELAVEPVRRARMEAKLRDELGPPPYIGVTWRAGVLPEDPKPQRGSYLVKEVPPEALARAIAPSNTRVVILQRKPSPTDLQRFNVALGRPALDLSKANDDLSDALALLAVLDEYVGVSNTNMHLRAGLPGRSARVLESMPPEWRWGLDSNVSPWFPGFTVYRRKFRDEWTGVLSQLQQDLL